MNGKAGRVREGRGCCAHSHQGRGLLSAGARTMKKKRGLLSGSCSSSTSIRSSGSVSSVVGVDLLQLPNGQPSKLHGHPGGVGMLLAALCLRRLRIWFWGGVHALGGGEDCLGVGSRWAGYWRPSLGVRVALAVSAHAWGGRIRSTVSWSTPPISARARRDLFGHSRVPERAMMQQRRPTQRGPLQSARAQ